jgi:hypothetical protein
MKTIEEVQAYREGIIITSTYGYYSDKTILLSEKQQGMDDAIGWFLKGSVKPNSTKTVEEVKAYRDGIKNQTKGKDNTYSDKQQGMLEAIDWILGEGKYPSDAKS